MAKDETTRPDPGELISFFRWLKGWSQAKLARRTGIDGSQISLYESGAETPRPANLQRILAVLGVPLRVLEVARWCLRLIRKAMAMTEPAAVPADGGPERRKETRLAIWRAVDLALSMARAELGLLRRDPEPGRFRPPTSEDHERVEALWERLKGYSLAKRRLLIEGAEAFREWLLCERICVESEKVAADDPREALALAELALFVARHVPGTDAWRSRLQGWCLAFIGNAQRVLGESLTSAEATFARAWRLWQEGEDTAGLLSAAYLLDLEASLRRAQRLFPQALKLHTDALKLARPEQVGVFLLNKSATLETMGDYQASIETLGQAAAVIDGARQPRLRFGLRFNQAANLIRLCRAAEAVPIVHEVRELAELLQNDIDLVKTLWLEGNLYAGLGRRQEALAALEQVRRDFETRALPYNHALASLDLALLYREEGRFAEIAVLAGEMRAIFEAQKVHREAIASVLLFREAAEKGRISVELVRRLRDYLTKARSNPRLRFEA